MVRQDRGIECGLDLGALTMSVVGGARNEGVRAARYGVSVAWVKKCREEEKKEVEIVDGGPE